MSKLNLQGYVTILPAKKPSIIDEILEYLVKNRYNETNPVMYAFIASKHQSILPVKEKMFTREEVIKLFILEREHREKTSHFIDKEDLPNWINKQNL